MAKDDRNLEEQEQQNLDKNSEELDKDSEKNDNKTPDELFSILAEGFNEFISKNVSDFVGLSLNDIFLKYLEKLDKEGKNILALLEEKLGRQINFDDIKNLYLTTGHTLFEEATEKIFSKLKNHEISKAILEKFIEKIFDEAKKNNLTLDISKEELESIINNSVNLSEAFRGVRAKLTGAFKNLGEEKEKLKNLKIYNYEILNYLLDKNLLTKQEYDYLQGKINHIIDDVQKNIDLPKLLELQNALISGNFLENLDKVSYAFDKLKSDFEEIFGGIPVWKVLKFKFNPSLIKITNIFSDEELWNILDEKTQDSIKSCIGQPNEANCLWEKILELPEDKKNKIFEKLYVNSIEFPSSFSQDDKKVYKDIFYKLLNKKELTEKEIDFIKKLFFPLYKEKLVKILSSLNPNFDKKALDKYLDFVFNTQKGKLNINGVDFDAESFFDFPVIDGDLSDILNGKLNIKLTLKGPNIKLLSDIFPEYFVPFKDDKISIFSKVKVKTKNGDFIEGYLDMDENGNYVIYSYPGGSLNADNSSPIRLILPSEIDNIEVLDEKLELNGPKDISKLAFNLKSIESISALNGFTKTGEKPTQVDKNIDKNLKLAEFKDEWKSLYGDKNCDFKKGAVLSVKGTIIEKLPGLKKNWYNIEVVDIDEENLTWTIKPYGGVLNLQEENQLFTLPIDAKLLRDLKFDRGGGLYRFSKFNGLDSFVKNLNNANLLTDNNLYESTLSRWKNAIKIQGNKLVNENGEEINYIGRIKDLSLNNNESIESGEKNVLDYMDVFKVQVEKNYVILTHPYIKGFSKKVDYNTFLMIIMDNGLEPWSKSEFSTYEKDFTSYAKASSNKGLFNIFGLTFYYSVGNLIFSFKELVNAAKANLKEEDDFRAAELLAGITSHIPHWMPLVGDLAVEATAEKEAKIWKRINAAKSRLERADKGGNHAKVAAKLIKEEIFKPVLAGKELSYKKKLRAAGYLLYALEKGPSEYFRALADYAGKGVWVKALFGEAHYKKWLLKNQQLKEELKKDPNNETLRNQLVFSEIFYMKDIPESTELYSANFSSAIEGGKINVYDDSKVNNVLNSERVKSNYYTIYDGVKSYILNARWANSIGALKALSERVEEEDHYVDYYKVHLMFSITGFVFNDLNTSLKENYEKVCRTYGIPLGLYASKLDGVAKIMTILDAIVKAKDIKPGGYETLTEYLYGVKDPFSINIDDLRDKTKRGKIIAKLENFWPEYGTEIVRVLDYRDPLLFNNKIIESLSSQEKEIIKEYFGEKVNDIIDEDFAIDPNLFVTGFAPYYTNGVFNLGKKAFAKVGGFSEGEFKSGKIGKNVRASINRGLDRFKDEVPESKNLFKFILDKYLLWLGEPYNKPYNLDLLVQALLSKDDTLLEGAFLEVVKEYYGHYYTKEIPVIVEKTLHNLIDLIKNTPDEFIIDFLKSKYSNISLQKAVKNLKGLLSDEKLNSIKVKLGLDKFDLDSEFLDENLDTLINNFITEDLQISNNSALYYKLKSLLRNAIIHKKEIDLNFLAEGQQNAIKKFLSQFKTKVA